MHVTQTPSFSNSMMKLKTVLGIVVTNYLLTSKEHVRLTSLLVISVRLSSRVNVTRVFATIIHVV